MHALRLVYQFFQLVHRSHCFVRCRSGKACGEMIGRLRHLPGLDGRFVKRYLCYTI